MPTPVFAHKPGPTPPQGVHSLSTSQGATTSRLSTPLRNVSIAVLMALAWLVILATPAFAASAPSLNTVLDNLRNWLVGVLAAVATVFLTVGGLRYITAGGDPVHVEKAKTALKSAAIGYAMAALAPLLVSILSSVVGQ